MKESWFFFPMKYLFRALGGIPVSRKRGGPSLTDIIIRKFNESSRLCLAIAPEGTRSRVTEWHTGFLHIAYEAKIPVVLGAIDAERKLVHLERLLPLQAISRLTCVRSRSTIAGFKGYDPINSLPNEDLCHTFRHCVCLAGGKHYRRGVRLKDGGA